jgi:hypothetical protein
MRYHCKQVSFTQKDYSNSTEQLVNMRFDKLIYYRSFRVDIVGSIIDNDNILSTLKCTLYIQSKSLLCVQQIFTNDHIKELLVSIYIKKRGDPSSSKNIKQIKINNLSIC